LKATAHNSFHFNRMVFTSRSLLIPTITKKTLEKGPDDTKLRNSLSKLQNRIFPLQHNSLGEDGDANPLNTYCKNSMFVLKN